MHDLDLHGVARLHHSSHRHKQLPTKSKFSDGEQKIIAKLAVYPDNSSIWFSAKNRYNVDWGDGKSQNYRSGDLANHCYDYNKLEIEETDGYKIVTVIITPQKRYHLTDIDFDPKSEDETLIGLLSTANWISIEGSLPNLCNVILTNGKVKAKHPLLKKFSISN